MSINEIFKNPTVKTVAFEIRFPNLFYIENKIGEFQIEIMHEFPESALTYRGQVLFADMGQGVKAEDISARLDKDMSNKVWEFQSPKNYKLSISSRSLVINSEHHKTYNLGGADKFRDTIKFVLDNFFKVVSIPIIGRVGLRYIDECPIL